MRAHTHTRTDVEDITETRTPKLDEFTEQDALTQQREITNDGSVTTGRLPPEVNVIRTDDAEHGSEGAHTHT